jgi:hypothetical protein
MPEEDRHKWPLRGLRGVPTPLWRRFGQLVGDRNRSTVLVQFIRWYVGEPGAKRPTRPTPPASKD